MTAKLFSSLLLCAGLTALTFPVRAASFSDDAAADLKRAFAAAALSTSEEPAVRAERARGEPSAGFMLGAALGAWTAAKAQLDYDLKNPQAAGAAHASQGPANLEAIDEDCREEKVAFERLDSRSRALGLEPSQTLAMAGADAALAEAWRIRRAGPDSACR